jgi:hypothetical protein
VRLRLATKPHHLDERRMPSPLAAAAAAALSLSLLSSSSASYTILPNTRCHNDVGQAHNITAYTDCEGICLTQYGAPLFTYCPAAGADGCGPAGGPQPLTCWCFPFAELSTCEASAGWTSGYSPPTPPTPPPADWAARIAAGQMAFTSDAPELVGEGYFPVVANGFLGFEAGPYTQPFVNAWPWRDAGSLKLAGVYSGLTWETPSHRAQIPKLSDLTLTPLPPAAGVYVPVGAAVDFAAGLYLNRTRLVNGTTGSGSCPDDTTIEQRMYAHRGLRELFVFEVRAMSTTGDPAWRGCTDLPVSWPVTSAWLNDTLLTETVDAAAGYAVWSGTTTVAEEAGLPLRSLAVVFDSFIADSAVTTLTFTPASPIHSVRAVLRSDLDVVGATSPADVAAAAIATWTSYAAQSSDSLLTSHTAAMDALWAAGGVELTGNATFAATVNASLYDIVSSLRSDFNWSTSPGGIATGGYAGHSFWDLETWMFPVLTVLFPDLARATAQYRIDRLPASLKNAELCGYDGAMWAWESASTGLWTAPWREADLNENHISSDIPLAWRRFYYATGDETFLASAWPALNATCAFWECRFTRTDSAGPLGPAGYGPNCSSKDGTGNWTVKGVISPDESSGIVNDSAYTNAGASQTLSWCLEAASILGIPPAALPPLWLSMAASPYLPLNASLYPLGPVHAQSDGYNGHEINQADVALLQYPLGLDFGPEQNKLDLDYYSSVTNFAGMFTGDSAYACAYLALGNRSAADAQLQLAFNHIEPHFYVFHETAFDDGHTQHFITGSGGYLQSFVFGYAGLRIPRVGVLSFSSSSPILPPLNVSAVTLRGLDLLGTAFDFSYDADSLCATLQAAPAGGVVGAGGSSSSAAVAAPLELRVLATGQRIAMTQGGPPACVTPVQAVEVAGVGYL